MQKGAGFGLLCLLVLSVPVLSHGGSLHWGGRSGLSGRTQHSRTPSSARQFRHQHRFNGRHGDHRQHRPGFRSPHSSRLAPFAGRLHRSRNRHTRQHRHSEPHSSLYRRDKHSHHNHNFNQDYQDHQNHQDDSGHFDGHHHHDPPLIRERHPGSSSHGGVYLWNRTHPYGHAAGPPPLGAAGAPPLGAVSPPSAVLSSPFYCYLHKRGYTKQDQFISHLYQHHKVPRRGALSTCHTVGSSLVFLGN